jgi:dolichol-phosphate mannosyltransferase
MRAFRIVQAGCGALALARLGRGRTRRPPLSADGVPAPEGDVSVVIPARHEEERISPCLAGILADPDVAEVIVVVDHDEHDATAELAAAAGARVVEAPPPPAGWIGKPWALQHGLEAASGEYLVQLDADTRPEPGLVRALVAELAHADVVSAGTRFICDTVGERLLHPAMLATLVYRLGPPGTGPVAPHRAAANGQCLAVRRAALAAAGGFGRAPEKMTDDFALVRSLAADGWRIEFLDGADLISVRMHTSLGEVWREWGRSLSLQDVTPKPWLVLDLAVVWLALALPLPRVLARRATWVDRLLVAARLALVPATRRVYERRGVAFWLSPLADPAAALNLTLAAVRPRREWRGRVYGPRGIEGR